MARLLGKDVSTITIHGTDMKADTLSIDFGTSVDAIDSTTIGDSWKEVTAGLKGGDSIAHTLMYDNTATTGSWAVYTGKLTGGALANITIADGSRTIVAQTLVTNLSLPIAVADMLKITATHQISGPVTFT